MTKRLSHWVLAAGVGLSLALSGGAAFAAAHAKPKRGGTLKYVIPAEPPSFDGHRETTFALIHPIAPFYSTLIRVNPENPSSPTDFVCDLCTEMPTASDDGKRYVFNIRKGVKFHDGKPLTAHDVAATFERIIFPPQGVASARKAFFVMVDKVAATDDHTIQFDLKYPSGAFLPSLANPYNFVYAKARLDADQHWYEKNIEGSGPFKFVELQPGAVIKGERNPDYYHEGKPYLDGFEGIFAKKQSLRVQAVRGGQAQIEFRGFPPKSRDDLVAALGDKITVQESDWNCVLLVTPNHKSDKMKDPRVRKALTLAIDRWGGSKYLSEIAIVKAVGGIAFPGHPLAATKAELEKIPGYWPDLDKSRAEAKKLLAEAGFGDGLSLKMNNRAVDQPYKIVGVWLIDQWKQIGVTAEQQVLPTGPFYDMLRKQKTYDISLDFNCQAVVNPLLDVSKFISDDKSGNNYANYQDREVDRLFEAMNQTADVNEQRKLMREMEMRVLGEEAHSMITLWWYRIIPHRSEVKGWKISPSHYLNQDLSSIWIDQ
ncbi:MAG: ABC transporter substrate-binding protein [Alphaproteobacteria bacterium]